MAAYPALLPAAPKAESTAQRMSSRSPHSGALRQDSRRARKHVVTACAECRRRRRKCSGSYPCADCKQRGVKCIVTEGLDGRSREVKAQKSREAETDRTLLHDLVRRLRLTHYARLQCDVCAKLATPCDHALPPQTLLSALANEVSNPPTPGSVYNVLFQLLRSAPENVERGILQSIRSGASPSDIVRHYQDGSLWAQLAVVPETRLHYDFPYNPKMPTVLLESPSPYFRSLIYEAASALPLTPENMSTDRSTRSHDPGSTDNPAGSLASEQNSASYAMPFHAAEIYEPRLTDVKPSQWTTVCNDNYFMRGLLQAWFRCEYQFSAAFQKDLFLEDMASERTDFCSPLLVNVVLAYACICDTRIHRRAEYWDPSSLVYRFLAEAKRLWELEATRPRVSTIQAGIIFTVFHNLCGLDEIGAAYRVQAVALAHKIRLSDRTLGGESSRIERGRAFTAWALYSWETLTAFSFMQAPLMKKPPDWPLPEPEDDTDWYGEIWVRYPLSPRPSSAHFAHTLHQKSLFRILMNGYCDAAFSKDRSVDIAEAYQLHERLQAWFQDLPEPLLPRTILLPAHLQLHIYYYHLILTIFLPFILVRLYYLRHGFEAMDLFIVIPLMLLGYDCIDVIADPKDADLETLRSTLILAISGLYAQRRNHYLAEALFCVLRGRMRSCEAALLQNSMSLGEWEAEERKGMAQAVRSHWPVMVVKKREEVEEYVLGSLVETYGGLRVDD